MKTNISIVALLLFTSNAQNYLITFAGTGASTTVSLLKLRT